MGVKLKGPMWQTVKTITLENSLERGPGGDEHIAHGGKNSTPAVFPTVWQQIAVFLVEYQMK